MDFQAFENKVGIAFTSKDLLKQAFIHRSYLNENRGEKLSHNERLEFLGDAVLELVSTTILYNKYTHADEGLLTAYRSALVNAVNLSEVATEIGIEEFLLLSHGESRDKGKARQYILANTMEALIGALYLDGGYDAAYKFVERFIMSKIDAIVESGAFIDAKSLFQEKAQEHEGQTPAYKSVRETGPDHDKRFIMGVFLGNEKVAEGEGKSKQEAEQQAANKALKAKNWFPKGE